MRVRVEVAKVGMMACSSYMCNIIYDLSLMYKLSKLVYCVITVGEVSLQLVMLFLYGDVDILVYKYHY